MATPPYDAETTRLYLERLAPKHLDDFHLIWSSSKTLKFSLRPPMQNLEQSRAWMEKSLPSATPRAEKFGIMLKPAFNPNQEEGKELKMIGLVGTKDPGDEMVYMLHCDFWNQGYMTEALAAFLGPQGIFWKLENRKHIDKLVAMIDAENIASIKTIAKVGGREGEVKRKEYALPKDRGPDGVVPEEKLRDMVCWYVDRPESV